MTLFHFHLMAGQKLLKIPYQKVEDYWRPEQSIWEIKESILRWLLYKVAALDGIRKFAIKQAWKVKSYKVFLTESLLSGCVKIDYHPKYFVNASE